MCAMVSGLVSGRTLHDFARGLHLQRCLALDVAGQWCFIFHLIYLLPCT